MAMRVSGAILHIALEAMDGRNDRVGPKIHVINNPCTVHKILWLEKKEQTGQAMGYIIHE